MQCADVTFSSEAEAALSEEVCFNSTGVDAAPFTYGSSAATSAASSLQMPMGVVGAVGLLVAAFMM